MCFYLMYYLFFFNDTATTEIYTLSLHDALPILNREAHGNDQRRDQHRHPTAFAEFLDHGHGENSGGKDRKSTRLNSSHPSISYAVFCLKKKRYLNTEDTHSSSRCRRAITT